MKRNKSLCHCKLCNIVPILCRIYSISSYIQYARWFAWNRDIFVDCNIKFDTVVQQVALPSHCSRVTGLILSSGYHLSEVSHVPCRGFLQGSPVSFPYALCQIAPRCVYGALWWPGIPLLQWVLPVYTQSYQATSFVRHPFFLLHTTKVYRT